MPTPLPYDQRLQQAIDRFRIAAEMLAADVEVADRMSADPSLGDRSPHADKLRADQRASLIAEYRSASVAISKVEK